jgi:hypothetical protein
LTLSEYAAIAQPALIRLRRDDPPDAYLRQSANSKQLPIEITEVMEPGRQRGLEYRPRTQRQRSVSMEEIRKRAEEMPEALSKRIKEKQQGNYPADTMLLVYLNFGNHGVRHTETEREIRNVLSRPSRFTRITIIWQGKLILA